MASIFEETSNRIYKGHKEERSLLALINSFSKSIDYLEIQVKLKPEMRDELSDLLLGQIHGTLRIFKEIAEDANRSD